MPAAERRGLCDGELAALIVLAVGLAYGIALPEEHQ
jgi:hypothetical protein